MRANNHAYDIEGTDAKGRARTRSKRQQVAALAFGFALAAGLLALGGCSQNVPTSMQNVGGGSSSAATGASSTDEKAVDAPDAQPLSIEESGWWAKDGYVHYGLIVSNPNADLVARATTVHVTLYDETGAVAWEQDDTIQCVGPSARIGFAEDAGDGWAPARVEFSIDAASTVWEDGSDFVEPFSIVSFEEEDKLCFRYELTGEITNNSTDYASTAALSIILRGDDGSIIAGYTGSAYRIKGDRTKSFLVTLQSAPEHASTEVYAQPV